MNDWLTAKQVMAIMADAEGEVTIVAEALPGSAAGAATGKS